MAVSDSDQFRLTAGSVCVFKQRLKCKAHCKSWAFYSMNPKQTKTDRNLGNGHLFEALGAKITFIKWSLLLGVQLKRYFIYTWLLKNQDDLRNSNSVEIAEKIIGFCQKIDSVLTYRSFLSLALSAGFSKFGTLRNMISIKENNYYSIEQPPSQPTPSLLPQTAINNEVRSGGKSKN